MTATSPFRQDVAAAESPLETSEAAYATEHASPFAATPLPELQGLDFAETEGLDFAETEGLDFAETEGLDVGEAEGLAVGQGEDLEAAEAEDFDFGEAQDEAAHPILSAFAVPMGVVEALSRGLPSLAVTLAAGAGFHDVSQLTNIVFYFRHPDRIGRKIGADDRDLAAEWISIRDRIVKPALQPSPAGAPPTGAGAPPAVSGPALSSSMLQWPGVSDEKLAFMKAVYDRHAARSQARGAGFVADLPESALEKIEGHQARKDAAQAAKAMLAAARAQLAAEGQADRIRIGILSAYRPATRQFEIWQGRSFDGRSGGDVGFPHYYAEWLRLHKERAGDYGPDAVDKVAEYLGGYIASPGYSNHQDGRAFDFGIGQVGKGGLGKLGWKSWFRHWLEANAKRFKFRPLATEAWHWTFHPTAESEVWAGEVASTGVRARRIDVARVPVLASHRGSPPDLVLHCNEMSSIPQEIDVVVHLHGFWYPRMTLKRDIEPVSGLDLAPVDGASGAGRARPTLTVLPRGNYTGIKQQHGSYYAYTFPALVTRDGLPQLVRFALERFAAEVGGAAPRVGRLILTAHSGGGKALLQILRYHDPHQVHVFDALYWPAGPLAEWALKRIRRDRAAVQGADAAAVREYMATRGGALRVFYQGRYKGGTRPFSLALREQLAPELDARLADWYRVEASRYDHFQIPRRYGWRVLSDASASVPDASVEAPVRHEAELEELAELEDAGELWAEDDKEGEEEDEGADLELEGGPFAEGAEGEDEGEWVAGLPASELDEAEALDEDLGSQEAAFEEEAPSETLAARLLDAIGRGLWDTAVRIAIGSGITDVNRLTNTLFYLHHPQLRGRTITPDQRDLAREWVEIRDRWVKPALAAQPASPAAGATAGAGVRIKPVKSGHAAYGGGRLDASLRRLVANGSLQISERDIDTLQRIADVESSGLANALNSWDSAVMSIGFKQWTLRYDELQDLIVRAPEAFARHGIRLAPDGAQYVFGAGAKRTRPRAIDGVPDPETLRNEDWGRRFFLAGLEPEAIAAAARKALDDVAIVETAVRKVGWSPHFDSARGRALLVELHNNRPAYVNDVVGRTLTRAAANPGLDEGAFLEILVDEIVAAYARKMNDPDKGRRLTQKIMRR